MGTSPAPLKSRWTVSIPAREWGLYSKAIEALRNAGVHFLLGGGFAFASYTGRWRDTKDIDFYIQPADREAAVRALRSAGFEDYYDHLPYDRRWIYRSTRSEVIVDIIWAMANQRAQVDRSWFASGRVMSLRGVRMPVLAIEEMIWCKLYILQRDRCDWTDVFNLTYAAGPAIDWDRLIRRLGDDTPLLEAMLRVYSWFCPESARKISRQIWKRLHLPVPTPISPAETQRRAALLDSRGWFCGVQPVEKKLEI